MTRLHDTLHEIADEAPAVDLADRAIRRSRHRRRTGALLVAAAATAVAVLGTSVATGLLPGRGARDMVASPVGPRSWEISSSPLPARGVDPLSYAYLTSCTGQGVPPDCVHGVWRVVTRGGETYDVPQALGLGGSDGSVFSPLVITPDGRAMAYYSRRDRTFKVRELESGKEFTAPVKVGQEQLEAAEVFLRLSGDGRRLAFTSFGPEKPLAVSIDMRNGRTTRLPTGWMPVSVADGGGPVVVVRWADDRSRIRLVSPGGEVRESGIPEYGQRFSAFAPDGRTMTKIGNGREDDRHAEDGTLVVFDSATGKVQGRIRIRGLPEDTTVIRLGHWLNDTEVTALTTVSSADAPPRDAVTTVYAVNVRTGGTRELHSYPSFSHLLVPGIVM
ncbi:PD40 domain-containing protein [Planomonospora venezuelensis]|uniref:WD40-like Beta Propeller Repeat n=1 Tax=Planomonospora venezuelensis TaxID=1999 RepID=A0A841CTZ0_PLAVE|nr:PD40 domain-containing protein [Planomonospora venezuelensis]MBB5961291.1 hypothetical protein [Planomonospora venezuelensis]GIM99965.1 hypothetical protein Pve01_16240 [Planomonospora venezuelensis]